MPSVIPIITLSDPQKNLQKRHATLCWVCHRETLQVQDLTISNKIDHPQVLSVGTTGYRIRMCRECISLLHEATAPRPSSDSTSGG